MAPGNILAHPVFGHGWPRNKLLSWPCVHRHREQESRDRPTLNHTC